MFTLHYITLHYITYWLVEILFFDMLTSFSVTAKKVKKHYADNPKVSPIYVVREMLGFRSD